MLRTQVAVVALAALPLLGCGAAAAPVDALRPAAPPADAGCPAGGDGPGTVVDYVPFVRHEGRQYVDHGAAGASVPDEQVGREVGTVTCRLDGTGYDPARPPQDGDAAFLPVGTALHELAGASPAVRLVARDGATWRLYEVDDDPAARSARDLLDLRDVVRVSLVEAERGEDVVRSVSDPAEVARLVEAVAGAPLLDRGEQGQAVRGPQWFVRFDLAEGPPVQRAWYPEGRWLFPRIASPEALHEALLG